MAVANSCIFSLRVFFNSAVLFFFCYSNKLCAYGAPYRILKTDTLRPKPTYSASTTDPAGRSQGLPVYYQHKKSPSSRSMNKAQTSNPYHIDKESEKPAYFKGAETYYAVVGVGTPQSNFKLMIDTGSDPTWIQCKSCYDSDSCSLKEKLEQGNRPMFDPSKSSSYSNNGSCSSVNVQNPFPYADGSKAYLQYGCDTVFLQPSSVLHKFQFGCGQGSITDFDELDGILGLGPGPLSLPSQAASTIGKVFSYCLPLKSSNSKGLGHIYFGKEAKAVAVAASLKFTPLKSTSNYFLSLNGISVANKKLDVSPSVFKPYGTIIDSGTVYTKLPSLAYSALQSAFIKSMSRYPLANVTKSEFLQTCYKSEGINYVKDIPEVVLHFGGGTDVTLSKNGVVTTEKDDVTGLSLVCLAFVAHDVAIIGNHQQQTLEVFYDLEGNQIGFGTNGC